MRRRGLQYPDLPLHHFVQAAARDEPAREVLRFDDDSMSYGELDDRGNRLANALRGLGVEPSARVLLSAANRTEWVVAQHGLSVAGAAAVLGNPSWKAAELDHAIALTAPVAVVADAASAAVIDAGVGGAPAVRVCLDDPAPSGWHSFAELVRDASNARPTESVRDAASHEVLLPFSSGTTGLPKAVRHSHASLVHATVQRVDAYRISDVDRLQYFMALFTIFGVLVLTTTYAARASLRLFRRFDAEVSLRNLADERITVGFAAAPVAVALRDRDDLEAHDLSSMRYFLWGATPIVPEVAESFTTRTGVPWLGAYATTEVGVTSNPAEQLDACRLDSPGYALADVEVRILDPDTLVECAVGTEGEIVVRSPALMLGYLPAADDHDVLVDGDWFRTGDVGWLEPDGWLHITDRLKEMIKASGFSVAPAEIERVLFAHPNVADCAVYGMADARRGEAPTAAVVLVPGAHADADELQAFVAERLAAYKQLARVRFVDAIPRNAAGKALRRVLRAEDEGTPDPGDAEHPTT